MLIGLLWSLVYQANHLIAQKFDTVYYDSQMNLLSQQDFESAQSFELRSVDRKGRQNGKSFLFSIDGQLISETEYVKGIKSGAYVLYEENNIKTLGSFGKGLKTGTWLQMKSDTVLLTTQFYENGLLVGSGDFTKDIVIIDDADTLPDFPGGQKGWNDYLRSNLSYPQEALSARIQGGVYLTFIVLESGKVIYPRVTESPSPILSKEAIRIINLSPNWNPAIKEGKAVASEMRIRIVFRTN
jgi:TonB family protein